MDIRIRQIKESDYEAIISVLDEWWGGRQMAAMLPRLFFKHFNETSLLAEIDSKKVGFLIGFFSAKYNSEAYIHFVGGDPDYRKIDIGRFLNHHFFDLTRRHGR